MGLRPAARRAGPFDHRHQHDAHDTDAANQQTHSRHRTEQHGEYPGRAGESIGELPCIHHLEVIIFALANDTDRLACPLLQFGKSATGSHRPVACRKIAVIATVNYGGSVISQINNSCHLVDHRCDHLGGGNLVADGFAIV